MKKQLKPNSLSFIFSLGLGILLLLIVLVAFLRFSGGNIWVALSMAFMSTLVLSLFLSWVDVKENEVEETREKENKFRRMIGRQW